jgi:hypothetical protein
MAGLATDRADRGVSRLDRAVDTVDGAAAPCACRRELAAPRRFAAADQRAAGCYCGCAQKLAAGAHKEAGVRNLVPLAYPNRMLVLSPPLADRRPVHAVMIRLDDPAAFDAVLAAQGVRFED